jgi:hypothetical protein
VRQQADAEQQQHERRDEEREAETGVGARHGGCRWVVEELSMARRSAQHAAWALT